MVKRKDCYVFEKCGREAQTFCMWLVKIWDVHITKNGQYIFLSFQTEYKLSFSKFFNIDHFSIYFSFFVLVEVNLDRKNTEMLTLGGMTDFSKLSFTLMNNMGNCVKIMASRCGGQYSKA